MKEDKSKKARLISTSIIFSIILVLSGMALIASAEDMALPPNHFAGSATLNGAPAPINTTINATIDGVLKGTITVKIAGKYGDFNGLDYLDVKGDDSVVGKTINFRINGVDAEQTVKWIKDVSPRRLDLSAVGTSTGDDIPPTINIKSPSSGHIFDVADITVSGNASDNVDVASVEVKLRSGSWMSVTKTDSWNETVTLIKGPNTIYAKATDTSGLTAETSITVHYNLPTKDTTPPNISITSPVSDTSPAAIITVSGNASDNEGLVRVEVKVGSGDSAIINVSGTTASWSETVTLIKGPNTIYATAVDISGNHTTTSTTVYYHPPDSTGETVVHGGSTGGSVSAPRATSTRADTQPVSGNITSTTLAVSGTSTPAATSVEESGAELEGKKGQVSGFEAMFAIAGLLVVIHILRRR